jgi:phosphatidylglycerol:prolipoprotein diacylglycerol transferase
MRRVLFHVPGLGWSLHSFGPLLLIACAAALWLANRRARREGIDPDTVPDLAVWLFAGGFIGARLQFLLQNPGTLAHWTDAFKVWQGGITFYGCILGGLAGSLIFWSRRRFPFLATADAVAPALALAVAIGRVGCFLNGCCFGEVCQAPWAVRFPAESFAWVRHVEAGWIAPWAPRSLPVHPKQLYLAAGGLGLFGLLTWYFPRRRRDGEVMALLMVAYPITRFATEFLRGDADGWYGPFTISQYISLALAGLGLAAWRALPPGLLATGPATVAGEPAPPEEGRAAA